MAVARLDTSGGVGSGAEFSQWEDRGIYVITAGHVYTVTVDSEADAISICGFLFKCLGDKQRMVLKRSAIGGIGSGLYGVIHDSKAVLNAYNFSLSVICEQLPTGADSASYQWTENLLVYPRQPSGTLRQQVKVHCIGFDGRDTVLRNYETLMGSVVKYEQSELVDRTPVPVASAPFLENKTLVGSDDRAQLDDLNIVV